MISTSSYNQSATLRRMHSTKSKPYNFALLLLLLIILEISSQGALLKLNPYIFSAVYMLCGIIIAILPLMQNNPLKTIHSPISFPRHYVIGLLIFITLLFSYYCKLNYTETPIDYTIADMLPVIKIMNQRALSAEAVYSIIPEIWDGMQPIYLPAMWLPFIPAVHYDFDMRWITFTAIIIGVISLTSPLLYQKKQSLLSHLIWLPIILFIVNLCTTNQATMTMTEEGIVIGWYALLGFTILKQNYLWIGVSVAMCLMSRYALAPWALMIGIVLLLYHSRSSIVYGVTSILLITIIMWLSGALEQLEIFATLQSHYLESIQSNPSKYEWMIHSSLGVAKYLPYEYLHLLHRLFLIMSFVIPAACFTLYFIRRGTISLEIFMICSLKLSLVFFFNLLIMPYSYLFYTSTIISIALWMIYTQKNLTITTSE